MFVFWGAFPTLIRTYKEGTPTRKITNKFGCSLVYSYLCSRKILKYGRLFS